ncbi:outer membrane beta-barrel protein [Phaeovulum sp.]|uniref:outer membrane beta-barrel protein n=1 Tax=Phaeovulum sp. TaxID=2934796 RepID=UPI00272F2CC7|nr:outer membrane beta-barrel protein [Phaeovulum sp.]MDP1668269.1 outer membrane beta-barrel protein [Phaeovulum sp.]MDZ4118117.1 outer membrane beta-barrel protein [Phaeovulum sp.]
MKGLKTAVVSAIALGSVAAPAAAQQWNGAYVGGAVGLSGGGFNYNANYGDFNGGNAQLFAGYNMPFGNLVAGGELAVTLGQVVTSDTNNTYLKTLADLKLRLGTTYGSTLVYALVGYSAGTSFAYGGDNNFHGLNYGVGLDYGVNDRMFVGAELLARNIVDDSGLGYLDTRPMTTLSIRAGLRF